MTSLKDCIEWLLVSGYIRPYNSGYVFTRKFNLDYMGVDRGLPPMQAPPPPVKPEATIPVDGQDLALVGLDWVQLYQKFIFDSGIPRQGRIRGSYYDIGVVTKTGRETFKKMLETKQISYDLLVSRARAYYSAHDGRVKLDKFLTEEYWRNDQHGTERELSPIR